MQIKDLGVLRGDVLLFGGSYSNLPALEAFIDVARLLGIGPSNCICTGDVVAYCADAAASVARIRDFGCPVVAGNMEVALGAGQSDCGCGFEAGTTCDLLAGAWFAHAAMQMQDDARAWMAGCPGWITFRHGGKRVVVLHGAASDVARFMWSTTPVSAFEAEIRLIEERLGYVDIVVSGHSGIAFKRLVGDVIWLNAGVIGMPPNWGRPATQFARLSETGADIHTLTYDFEAASTAMEEAGLIQGYQTALRTGYWPSEDVLPPELRASALAKG